jgi:hypothetical protein
MTGLAVDAEKSLVVNWLDVARNALCRRSLEDVIHMALRAFKLQVSASQREGSFCMIESRLGPVNWRVAGTAVCPKLTLVSISLGMAGITILRRALEDVIDMTVLAGDVNMLTHQRESRQGMVKLCRGPALWRMAFTAVLPELPIMGVILFMAGEAILGGSL